MLGKPLLHRRIWRSGTKRFLWNLQEDNGVVDLPIGKSKDPDGTPRMVVDTADGRPSKTLWSVVQRFDSPVRRTMVRLEPSTGRAHQLRLHMKAIGLVLPIPAASFTSAPATTSWAVWLSACGWIIGSAALCQADQYQIRRACRAGVVPCQISLGRGGQGTGMLPIRRSAKAACILGHRCTVLATKLSRALIVAC